MTNGNTPIRTLLVANRGEVARRVFRTCRELGIRTVAVYSPPDAGAPFVAEADAAVRAAAHEAVITAAGARVGYPLLVKASAGGGGKGMRLVTRPEDLAGAVADAAREAAAAFGDPAVFLERYVSPGRHVEVQVLGDHHGTVVHLFERDCSVQRRHQKLVEESPSPAVDADLRARMGAAAVAA